MGVSCRALWGEGSDAVPFERPRVPFDRTQGPFERSRVPFDRTQGPFERPLVVISGERECREAAEQVAERIRQCGYHKARIHQFAVKNLIATADVGFHVRLGPLSDFLGAKCCSFTPELFPGLVYRNKKPKLSVMVFSSGKRDRPCLQTHLYDSMQFQT
ncbi:hypothetical protein niasHT_027944 [Heterodera trifolii]|uniref:Uncharacterized protein n=1 Tax=Heterodera trifolii TaxID=157864 RepID=A0ABD2JX63_9BILA